MYHKSFMKTIKSMTWDEHFKGHDSESLGGPYIDVGTEDGAFRGLCVSSEFMCLRPMVLHQRTKWSLRSEGQSDAGGEYEDVMLETYDGKRAILLIT